MINRRTFLASTAATAGVAGMPLTAWAEEGHEIKDMFLGDENAPLTVIEYASYTCPHCANFHKNVFKDVKKNYIDTGKVKFIIREVYFDRYGLWASIVARCGGESRFFGINDMLYEKQKEWVSGATPMDVVANLRTIGLTAGLTNEELDACLADQEGAKALHEWYKANAERDKIEGTPTFRINGDTHGNMNYADFAKTLDGYL
ncbi:thioredoxin domain-containing protein [Actibacterium pelagium]|uniref:Thiol-disulfide oxidoreductase n=1 Tax=Actibacterium pelagium TaxID=2029103 RepID=A0A917AJ83_9RHOB|nr:thioredoxin domain-containing protein [Actibacterium pelagium]GGE56174.1 thiol-disulfide oxidoreductase [Actibacterium pelagium]